MKKIVFVSGPAGIGKSTYCKGYIQAHPLEHIHVISSDETRKKICGSYRNFPPHNDMSIVYKTMIQDITKLYNENEDITILLDTTMLYNERRMFFYNSLPHFDETDLVLLKLHDYSVCYQRNKERIPEKWVPEEVISDMIARYEDPTPEVAQHFSHVDTVYLD
jgi:tRNA uridine 5-carbamoylmethylation protein Kti12